MFALINMHTSCTHPLVRVLGKRLFYLYRWEQAQQNMKIDIVQKVPSRRTQAILTSQTEFLESDLKSLKNQF